MDHEALCLFVCAETSSKCGDLAFYEIVSHLLPHMYFTNAFKCFLIPAH